MSTDPKPVQFTDEQSRRFFLFEKYYEPVTILIEAEVFESRNAQIVLNFDTNGILQVVERKDRLYSRRHTISPDS